MPYKYLSKYYNFKFRCNLYKKYNDLRFYKLLFIQHWILDTNLGFSQDPACPVHHRL